MRVETHTTDRKALAKAIGLCIGRDVHYDGVPVCSYSIGPVKVMRDGAVEWVDEAVNAAMTEFCRSNGWLPEEPQEHDEIPETRAADHEQIRIALEGYTPEHMENLIRVLYARQALIQKMLGMTELRIDDPVIDLLQGTRFLGLSDLVETMSGQAADGRIVGVHFKDNCLLVDVPDAPEGSERRKHCETFLSQVARQAQEMHRVKTVRLEKENEKYYANAWMIRLGFGGPEYKDLRNSLMGHLKGYAAFKNDAKMREHLDRIAARRAAAREAQAHDNA